MNDCQIRIRVPRELRTAIQRQADAELTSFSTVARRALAAWFMPNRETLRRCRTLVDPGVEYSGTARTTIEEAK